MPSEARTCSQNNLQAKCNNAKARFNLRPSFLQGSLEGLNQELENLSVDSSIFTDHKSDNIPDGHRAPINELLCFFRDSPNNTNHIININNITNTNKIDFFNFNINANNDITTNNNSNNNAARLKVNKDKKCCDLKLTAFNICDDIITHANDDKLATKSEIDEKIQNKKIQSKINFDEKQHFSPFFPSPHPPSLSSPLPPIDHLPFNLPTCIHPINQSTIKTQFLEEKDIEATTTYNNSTYSNNNNTTINSTNTSNTNISNKQLLIPSNQSAFTSVSKVTNHHDNHPVMTTSSLKWTVFYSLIDDSYRFFHIFIGAHGFDANIRHFWFRNGIV